MKTISLYGGDVHLEFDDRLHAYRWREKDLLVSGVTKIIGILDKPALVQWSANMACEFIRDNFQGLIDGAVPLDDLLKQAKTAHRRTSKDATDIGKTVHQFAEDVLKDGRAALPSDPLARKGAQAFLDWFHSNKLETSDSERMVFSKTWYYAGTVDWFGRLNGIPTVLDFKTSSSVYPEMLLQIAAYCIALNEELNEEIRQGAIVRLDKKTGKCEPYIFEITNGLKDAFLRVRETHECLKYVETKLEEVKANGISAKRAA
jgi:hypothetical protein